MSAANVSFTSAKLGLRIQNHDCGNCGRRNREARTANSESRIQNGDRGNREDRTVAEGNVRTRIMSAENVSFTTMKQAPHVQNPLRARIQNREFRIEFRTVAAATAKPESRIQKHEFNTADSELWRREP